MINQDQIVNCKTSLQTPQGSFSYYSLRKLESIMGISLSKIPFSIRVLMENMLRNFNQKNVTTRHIERLCNWETSIGTEISFMPARVLLQDFTGVPAVVDMAAMRNAVKRLNGKPSVINPQIPAELVIDHSVQIDYAGFSNCFQLNCDKEFERNQERYGFLRWGQKNFQNFNVVPPATGICHQVNLEYLARVVCQSKQDQEIYLFPDSVLGLDSHTTMINGIGVMGWGVGGIEAEAVMLGQPYFLLIPQVIGVQLLGQLLEGVTATDLVLTITQMLRQYGVVGKFVEFFGPGVRSLSVANRATIANMAPEYGATMGFFPVDDDTLTFLKLTGRSNEHVNRIALYCQKQFLLRKNDMPDPIYSDVVTLDMSTVKPCVAGPKRPQDRIELSQLKQTVEDIMEEMNAPKLDSTGIQHGHVVIASITSCTNTSNPSVMIGAGLLCKHAVEKGLKMPAWVKTSLAPGSKVVTAYLQNTGLLPYMEQMNFHLTAYGCATCIGNSGPLSEDITKQIEDNQLVVSAVVSGNRNFEGRISPLIKSNFLASPLLVVAFAIAGTVKIDLTTEPLGFDQNKNPVFLKNIWPSNQEIEEAMAQISSDLYTKHYQDVFKGDDQWQKLPTPYGELFEWQPESNYIKEPPFFDNMPLEAPCFQNINQARVLVLLGDSVTTDHISPAGSIPQNSPAAAYLISQGVTPDYFNSYGARRGNHEIMMRGTFGNIRLRNLLLPGTEGGFTKHFPSNETMTIYDAAIKYQENNVPLLVIAGKEYGTGSSRDWAAKGTFLLGVKAVLSQSFERIHRSNLIGMGVLPLQFLDKEDAESLGLTGMERYAIEGIQEGVTPNMTVQITAQSQASVINFQALVRLDSDMEVNYYQHGGILPFILRKLMKGE